MHDTIVFTTGIAVGLAIAFIYGRLRARGKGPS